MSQQRSPFGTDVFSNGFQQFGQLGANPFAAFGMPGNGAMPRFDAMAAGFMPPGFDAIIKGAARWNLELVGFMSRRAQAYLEIPSRVSQCRTPQDLFKEQAQFWRTAVEQYMETSQRLTNVATQMMAGASGAAASKQPRKRDYINVPGLGDAGSEARGRAERRVA